jgi:mRNA interferase MazF
MIDPSRGEIWLADLGTTRGHEQAGARPVLVLSVDTYNQGPADLVVVLPLTSRYRGVPMHIPLRPPEGGTKTPSVILCDAIRSISKDRLGKRWGAVSVQTIRAVEDRVRILLGL